MDANRIPNSNIKEVISATDTIGLYAGYPKEACDMETYIKSENTHSYREIAAILKGFVDEMNELIVKRLEFSQLQNSKQETISGKEANLENHDVPF